MGQYGASREARRVWQETGREAGVADQWSRLGKDGVSVRQSGTGGRAVRRSDTGGGAE